MPRTCARRMTGRAKPTALRPPSRSVSRSEQMLGRDSGPGARAGEGASRLPGRPKRRLRLRDRRGLAAHQAPERDDAPDARLSDPPNQAREPGCVRLGVQRLPRKDLRRGSGEASSRLPLKRGSVPPLSPGRSKRLWLRGSPPSPKPQRQFRFLGPPSPP